VRFSVRGFGCALFCWRERVEYEKKNINNTAKLFNHFFFIADNGNCDSHFFNL